jgi:hypothetical protein
MGRDPFEVRPRWEILGSMLVQSAAAALMIGLAALVLAWLHT